MYYFLSIFVNSVCQPISKREIERVFYDRIISRDLWPARSPDMTPPREFYLWGRLESVVYNTNPCNLEGLKRNIRDEINNNTASYGKFYKEVPKLVGQRRWIVVATPSIKLVSTTFCKIVTEIWLVVTPLSVTRRECVSSAQ